MTPQVGFLGRNFTLANFAGLKLGLISATDAAFTAANLGVLRSHLARLDGTTSGPRTGRACGAG